MPARHTVTPQPSDEARASYRAWGEAQLEPVKSLAARFVPWKLYRHTITGQLVRILAFTERGTVTMLVVGYADEEMDRLHVVDAEVFGVNPDNLVEVP